MEEFKGWDRESIKKLSILAVVVLTIFILGMYGDDIIRKMKAPKVDTETTANVFSIMPSTEATRRGGTITYGVTVTYSFKVGMTQIWGTDKINYDDNPAFVNKIIGTNPSTILIMYSSKNPTVNIVEVPEVNNRQGASNRPAIIPDTTNK